MSDQEYTPTDRFTSVATLLGNHFKFTLQDLPDLTQFAQTVDHPDQSVPSVGRPNPFTAIPEVGDHIQFGSLQVGYLIDNAFKTYFSLHAWFRGYAFPFSYDNIGDFNEARIRRMSNPRPSAREIQKTSAVLSVLQPDNDSIIAEIFFSDVFPTAVGKLQFDSTPSEPNPMHCQVNFAYSTFDVLLTNP